METKISFKPLKGGKFRCYLNGQITNIVTRNCESVRNRLYNQHRPRRVPIVETVLVEAEQRLFAIADHDHEWSCPNCGRLCQDGYLGKTKNCPRCGKSVKITGEKSAPQIEAFSS
jgi:hypothetical protein